VHTKAAKELQTLSASLAKMSSLRHDIAMLEYNHPFGKLEHVHQQ